MTDKICQTMPPILLEPGLRLSDFGSTDDGRMWLKFVNHGRSSLRYVTVFVLADSFSYEYAIYDRGTGTILAYEGAYGDPAKDTSAIYGA